MAYEHSHRHDWDSRDYVREWAEDADKGQEEIRQQYQLLADSIPRDKEASIRILDVGAGYGALTEFLLRRFPNAEAVCQDSSEEMARLGRDRMAGHKGRFSYAFSDFSRRGWSKVLPGRFDAVVSSRAIHNVRKLEIIKDIYSEIFPLVGAGGCFLNFDRTAVAVEEQTGWLREIGFKNVSCLWQGKGRALFGGFR
jgi:SAM-dependent methyltransferase